MVNPCYKFKILPNKHIDVQRIGFRQITYLLFCLIPCFCAAQFTQDYTPLSNKGLLPTDFTVRASQKFEQDNATLSKNTNKKADKTQFYLESNFSIDELLRSGSVLYDNAELTSYVRDVAAAYPELAQFRELVETRLAPGLPAANERAMAAART